MCLFISIIEFVLDLFSLPNWKKHYLMVEIHTSTVSSSVWFELIPSRIRNVDGHAVLSRGSWWSCSVLWGETLMVIQCSLGGTLMVIQCSLGGTLMVIQCSLGGTLMVIQCSLRAVYFNPLYAILFHPHAHLNDIHLF